VSSLAGDSAAWVGGVWATLSLPIHDLTHSTSFTLDVSARIRKATNARELAIEDLTPSNEAKNVGAQVVRLIHTGGFAVDGNALLVGAVQRAGAWILHGDASCLTLDSLAVVSRRAGHVLAGVCRDALSLAINDVTGGARRACDQRAREVVDTCRLTIDNLTMPNEACQRTILHALRRSINHLAVIA